jgi:hypothetical protein
VIYVILGVRLSAQEVGELAPEAELESDDCALYVSRRSATVMGSTIIQATGLTLSKDLHFPVLSSLMATMSTDSIVINQAKNTSQYKLGIPLTFQQT